MSREMRHSGVQWIGDIPKEWKMPRLKNVAELHGRIGWNGLRSDEFEEDSYAYLVTGQDFISSEISWDKCYQIRRERYDEDPFIQLNNGEILVTKDGTIGKIAIVSKMDKPGCLNSGIFVLRQKNEAFVPKFLYWQLYSSLLKTYNDYMNLGGTTIIHLYQNVFERMPLLTPSLSEQQKIADYLDKVCSDIDDMITLQEQMIEELKAYKQSVITEAVTKGIYRNALMRNSDIDWIGEIPKHWDIKRFKYLATIVRGGSPRPAGDERYYNGNIPFMKVADITKDEGVYIHSCEYSIKEAGLSNTRFIEPNTLLLTNSGATLGVPKINTFPTTFNDGIAAFLNLSSNIDILFAYYSLKARTKFFLESASLGIGQPNLNTDIIGNTKILLPPISEQHDICNYLNEKCSEIDSLITIKQAKIEALKEYKKSIIYEYVTGKKEVPYGD